MYRKLPVISHPSSYKQASGHKHPPPPPPHGYEPSFKCIEMKAIYFGVLKHNFKNTVNAKRFLIGTATGFFEAFLFHYAYGYKPLLIKTTYKDA